MHKETQKEHSRNELRVGFCGNEMALGGWGFNAWRKKIVRDIFFILFIIYLFLFVAALGLCCCV